MHNVYHSYVMTLSLTAIIVLSATLLFPLDSAFGQYAPINASTNTDGDTITISVPIRSNITYTDLATRTNLNSSFVFNPANYNITDFYNVDANTIAIVVSPPITPTTSLSLSYTSIQTLIRIDGHPSGSINISSVTNNVSSESS
ncbi:MAG: hypothetical protein R1F52_07070 [Candidatus Nitrosoabyssus spongiisocia]|nr:MAG: hypothetical protein R1F52_07070 [Nitrosopumilaceae archaeon AB1(1)]